MFGVVFVGVLVFWVLGLSEFLSLAKRWFNFLNFIFVGLYGVVCWGFCFVFYLIHFWFVSQVVKQSFTRFIGENVRER